MMKIHLNSACQKERAEGLSLNQFSQGEQLEVRTANRYGNVFAVYRLPNGTKSPQAHLTYEGYDADTQEHVYRQDIPYSATSFPMAGNTAKVAVALHCWTMEGGLLDKDQSVNFDFTLNKSEGSDVYDTAFTGHDVDQIYIQLNQHEDRIGGNEQDLAEYRESNDAEIAGLKHMDQELGQGLSDLSNQTRQGFQNVQGQIAEKLDKSDGTATNLRIHQMADGDEGATNKAYVDKLVSDAIKDTKKEHIKDFRVNTKANGVYEFVLTLDNGVQFKQEIDTPDERILNPNRPPYIDDNAHLILTFVDNTSVSVDLSKLVDTYKGSSNDYAVVEVSADNTIVVTLKESWRTLLDNARADYATWTGNENRRLATEGRLNTLETSLNSKLIQYEDINKTALDLISKANAILINAGIAEEESY